jgi:putative OPT family oligopeptide transporter
MSDDFRPYVPDEDRRPEFTGLAVVLGIVMAVILGSANAYLGLKAGMTVAATFPAAVVSMAVLRIFRRGILEENMARTVASVGEALVAGAIFTIPALVIAGPWRDDFFTLEHYLEATALMVVGGVLGVLFVTVLRKILVVETDLPFPESVAAAEIHKAGQTGGTGARYVFAAMGLAAVVELLKEFKVIAGSWGRFIAFGRSKVSLLTSKGEMIGEVPGGGGAAVSTFEISPALLGVGYIIGPRLASIAFAGGVLAWGLLVPLLSYVLGPAALTEWIGRPPAGAPEGAAVSWDLLTSRIWLYMVRPIAVGGMLVGVVYTLYSMRTQLFGGIGRAVRDIWRIRQEEGERRTDRDLNFRSVFFWIGVLVLAMACLYFYFTRSVPGAIAAALVMSVAGFFFAAVAGYLVGLIGSSNNPISGLTLSTLIMAALLMVAVGLTGESGIVAVLAVAAVVCCACGVAGDMLQDLKVGRILGGTPWRMEIGEVLGVIFAALVLFFPLVMLHAGDVQRGGIGFGGENLPAPQAGLMAMLTKGIVAGEMAWPLVIAGMLMGVGLILVQAPSPMLIAVGMYLPFETTCTIFVGGAVRWAVMKAGERRALVSAAKARVENAGVLLSSGLIAGEALTRLAIAGYVLLQSAVETLPDFYAVFDLKDPAIAGRAFLLGLVPLAILISVLYWIPLGNAREPPSQQED